MRGANIQAKEEHIQRLQQAIYDFMRQVEISDQYNSDDHGVTVTQSYTLLAFPVDGFITMQELSQRMNVTSSTMTRMADQLVKRGLIHRENRPEDRRVVQAQLTDAGRILRAQIEADYQQFFEMVLVELPSTEHETIITALESINAAAHAVLQKKHS